ncbi:ABC transporter permease [Verminephrobacter eiseniae]|uniref:ABC transporter permease n=1 Tax=Verminephrobacter eiseniae TaxID=364317 RepID=UPI0010E3B904|nr:SMP-30/gluconolactonase/LRE family protein [Verminephrobacter eiseniae]KAB7619618.1 ABC transporter permease [Verminephrobacter sp. Larva24]MCW5231192.1 ABC transporter permease [Verminephrobacter eiseniae]MCW5292923.1 ABC transporter permease [Verminephrobacter eiseniae]MCW8185836.1 ABC transporter permease [Verminephrobacter eiseniae]MCW8224607.1 ABC transporter permease [Verminephrobacter eiseniae]
MASESNWVALRYRLVPDHLIGEILSKKWIDNAIALLVMVCVVVVFGQLIPEFFTAGNLQTTSRQFGEFALVCLAMMIVVIVGGIDLSVGSNFALGNFLTLALLNLANLPLPAVIPIVMLVCAAVGLVNGVLIGYLRLRAFLTTLVTLIIVRAIVDMLLLRYAQDMSVGFFESDLWDLMGLGHIAGLPFSFVVLAAVAVVGHIALTRSRPGWRAMAIGGSRRSAHNIGLPVRATVCGAYVISGMLCGMGGILYAARLSGAGTDTGMGLEISALTAVVLGGNSLGGGRGSVVKALIGAVTVLILTNGVLRIGLNSGSGPMVLGLTLLFAVFIDVRWLKHRDKLLSKLYVAPTYIALQPPRPIAAGSGSPLALNDRLSGVQTIGLGVVESPEDVILDDDDFLYCGTRHGDIVRFTPPGYQHAEVFAHIGGTPLGMTFDKERNLLVCVGGMGLYRIGVDRTPSKLTDETNRSAFSVIDDSRLRLADDLDIAPDGRVFFSEATIRYEMHDWPVDALESRGNGRIICYDPRSGKTQTVVRNLVFPNGVCLAHDGQSMLFAESWACTISRYWISGPKAGRTECLIDRLPGYPDNINRASDGTYWVALMGMRSPALDVALRMPGFRRRMARRIAPDQWLYPNLNIGCVARFDDQGHILESMWDQGAKNHPMITSMREHKGWLYLGGITNNRIGRVRLERADPGWSSYQSYWGRQ